MEFYAHPFWKNTIRTCLLILAVAGLFMVSARHSRADTSADTPFIDSYSLQSSGTNTACDQNGSNQELSISDDTTKYLTRVYQGDTGGYGYGGYYSYQGTAGYVCTTPSGCLSTNLAWNNAQGDFTIDVEGGSGANNLSSFDYNIYPEITGEASQYYLVPPPSCPCGSNSCNGGIAYSSAYWVRTLQTSYNNYAVDSHNYTANIYLTASSRGVGYSGYGSFDVYALYSVEGVQCAPGEINTGGDCVTVTGTMSAATTTPNSPVISWTSNSNPADGVQIVRTGTSGKTFTSSSTTGSLTDSGLAPGTYTYTLYGYDGYGTNEELANSAGTLDAITITVLPPGVLNAVWKDTGTSSETMTVTPGQHIDPNLNYSNTGPAGSLITSPGCSCSWLYPACIPNCSSQSLPSVNN